MEIPVPVHGELAGITDRDIALNEELPPAVRDEFQRSLFQLDDGIRIAVGLFQPDLNRRCFDHKIRILCTSKIWESASLSRSTTRITSGIRNRGDPSDDCRDKL